MGHTYTESGRRVTITRLGLKPAKIVGNKQTGGMKSAAIGYQSSKHIAKPQRVELGKKGIDSVLNKRFETELKKSEEVTIGDEVGFEGFGPGDLVSVQGTSKGKGFAGVVKR